MGYDEDVNEAAAVASKVCTACGSRYPADALFCPSDGTPLQSGTSADRDAADPYLGQEISGHIEIRQLVGIGAMGRVYRAFQRGIDRDVAVKILHRELSANSQLVSRFTREAKVASRLQHPNVVQVLLAGQLPDRALYMVMEYLDGLSLQSALAAVGGALPLPRALHIVLQLCEAAGEAHAQGIVHRDLKPENVMLVKRGPDADFVKVLDFGIARINWGEQSVATAAGLIFGTARYISPEGAQGNAVGPASDVYSIATLLYQMLSGRTPFEGDQAVGLLVQQIHDPAPALRSLPRAQYVPEPIADVVMANLAKDPKRREPDGRALGQAILDAAKSAGLSPDDFSRPLHRRQPSAIQLPPVERTKQHELTPDLIERMTPPAPQANGNGHAAPQRPMGATAKWEPPADFQARLTEASEPSFPVAPAAAGSRPRTIDETMDDASVEAAPAVAAIATPPPIPTAVPRTIPGDAPGQESAPRTQYTPPIPEATAARQPSDPQIASRPPSHPSHPPAAPAAEPRRSRGVLLVVLCFVLGALIAAGWAWRTGRLGGDGAEQDRYVARATDAMFKNRFHEPPGDNVKDITDDGLRRWPNDRRLLDIRIRASNELTNQALAQRAAGDVAEALRLAKLAHELDPNDASSRRLAEQYETELAAFTSPSAPPLGSKPVGTGTGGVPATTVKTSAPPGPQPPAATSYKVVLDTSVAAPRLGQPVELTARVLPPSPPKGGFDAAGFTVVGPGVPGGIRIPAQSPAPGVFKASYAFLEAGKFDITFSVQADTKALSAKRTVSAGESAPPAPTPTQTPTAPTPTATGSVKWM